MALGVLRYIVNMFNITHKLEYFIIISEYKRHLISRFYEIELSLKFNSYPIIFHLISRFYEIELSLKFNSYPIIFHSLFYCFA